MEQFRLNVFLVVFPFIYAIQILFNDKIFQLRLKFSCALNIHSCIDFIIILKVNVKFNIQMNGVYVIARSLLFVEIVDVRKRSNKKQTVCVSNYLTKTWSDCFSLKLDTYNKT